MSAAPQARLARARSRGPAARAPRRPRPFGVRLRALRRRAAACALVLAALSAPAGPAGGEVPPCRVEVAIDPPRAFVGEQVVWRLRVLRRADVDAMHWGRPPTFPAFRAEWLPGLASAETHEEDGVAVRPYEERRALFPARAGRLVVPLSELVCVRGGEEHLVPIPEVALEAVPPPTEGRPEGWQGLVGPVQLSSSIAPRRVRLGEAVRVALVAQGPANLWDAPSPLEGAFDPEEAELFPVRRQLARDAARRLTLRRYFTYDVVPRRTGRLQIPASRLVTWEPERAAWRVAEAPGATILVEPALADEASEAFAPEDAAPAQPSADAGGDGGPGAAALVAALAVAAAAALAAFALARRRGRREAPEAADEDAWLARARRAEEAGDLEGAADALARALRVALGRALPGAGARATEELFAEAPGPARPLVLWLQRLDRLRFAPGGPSAAELRSVRGEIEGWRAAGGPERLARDC